MKRRTLVPALTIAALVAGCGASASTVQLKPTNRVRVYASLPRGGAAGGEAAQVARGIELALAQSGHRAGQYKVVYSGLDAGPAGAGATRDAAGASAVSAAVASAVAGNAREAARHGTSILYIGELESAPNAVSIPILSTAGIPQISPTASGAVLTGTGQASGGALAAPHTFMRLLPGNEAQAQASLRALSDAGCSRVALAFDASGASLAQLIRADASSHAVTIVSPTLIAPGSASLLRFPLAVREAGANCVELAASATPLTVQLTTRIHLDAPLVHLFMGSNGMCVPAWTNVARGGVQPSLAPKLRCTRPTLPVDQYPGGSIFRSQYMHAFDGAVPGVAALLGYTAMELGLDAIASLGRRGDERSAVLSALMDSYHNTALGFFTFDHNGTTTLPIYGLYKVGDSGNPTFSTELYLNSHP
jgi:branched-chain amino acid transport system substrate-binding protein